MKKNIKNTIVIGIISMISVFFFIACEKEADFREFNYPTPVVNDFTPKTGYAGQYVTITGENFGDAIGAVKVFFGGVASDSIKSVDNNNILVKVPSNGLSGIIKVEYFTKSDTTKVAYTILPSAKITNISTDKAQIDEEVVITGENFGENIENVSVQISGVEAQVTSLTNSEIKFMTPDADSGNIIINIDGQIISGPYLLIGIDKLEGILIGHSGSWQNNPATFITAAVDGDITTAVDAPSKTGYVGYDLGETNSAVLSSVRYVPRTGNEQRMVGGEIRGANDPSLSDAVTLYTITSKPVTEVYTEATITTEESYRYIYYYSSDGFCNIAEIEFYGNIIDAVIPEGKHIFEFDDPNAINYWVGVQGATNVIEDGKLKVTFEAGQFSGTSKRRADLKYVEGGVFPADTPTGIWRYSSEYPILAYKISFTGTDAVSPVTGNIKLDRFDNANNSYQTDFVSNNVIYYDVSTVITDSQDLASWQLKIADITSDETGYEIDWIRTFKSVADLEAFLQ